MQQKSNNIVSHYVFEAPVHIWHWLTVLCMAVLMVTRYFISKPLPSISSKATYLFYMGYIRLIHFSTRMVFTMVLLIQIYWAFVGNQYSHELFIMPVWHKSWWQGMWYEIHWYLFLAKHPSANIGHNPITQAAMFSYFLMSVFMIITGFALYSKHSQYTIFAPFHYVVEFFYWTGGNSMDIHSWHQLGMWLIGTFVISHVYMALHEDIMSNNTVISTMVNSYHSHKFGKISNKEHS